ncbi:MAG: lytic transglycosylase domain-containing protein [Spirochaetes bacterium]|nr:lytic transglycosylase domain-containing protein [Spirochaetota bacterium]
MNLVERSSIRVKKYMIRHSFFQRLKLVIICFLYLLLVVFLINIEHRFKNPLFLGILDTEINQFSTRMYQLSIEDILIHRYLSEKTNSSEIAAYLLKSADQYDIDFHLLYALMKVESGFEKEKVVKDENNVEQIGLFQLEVKQFSHIKKADLLDIETNIDLGAKLLKKYLVYNNENLIVALTSFRAGERIIKQRKIGLDIIAYIRDIRTAKDEIEREIAAYLTENIDLFATE